MRNDVINMPRARDREKNLSPRQKLNLRPSVHRSDALTTELRMARDVAGLYTRFLCTVLVACGSYHFSFFHRALNLPSLFITHMTIVFYPARLESFLAQWLQHLTCVKKVINSVPVGNSDFFSFSCSWHVDHIMSFLTNFLVGGILSCYHSSETSSAVLSHGTFYLVCSPRFWECGWNLMVLPFKLNLFSSSFTRHYYFVCSPNFWNLGWNPMLLPFNETSLVELLYGAIYFLGFHKRQIQNFFKWFSISVTVRSKALI